MNRLNLRRAAALAAGALIGLAGVAVAASPASAHHSEIKVTAECDTAQGEWVTTWTVRTYAPAGVSAYRLVKAEGAAVTGKAVAPLAIAGIATTPDGADPQYPHKVSDALVGTARLAGTATEASLTVQAQWDNTFKERDAKSASIKFSESCDKVVTPPPAQANPTATVTSDCAGEVTVKLDNAAEATKDAAFTVTGTGGFRKTAEVAPGKSATVTVPAENAGKIKVTEAGQEQPLFDDKPAEAKDCVEPGEPSGSYQSTCDELVFQIENPKDGETVEITFTPNKGEAKKLVVQPGETKTVTFKAFDGLKVTPTADGLDDSEPIAWEKPKDCTPGGGGGQTDGPNLPVTGPQAGAIAGGALLLLAAGAVLFVIARRRRVRFTA